MKTAALAVAAFSLLSAAQASPLTGEEAAFVSQMIGAATVHADCQGYEMVPNAAETIGSRMGVGANVRAAVLAAYAQTLDNQPFNRAYLIPEVTQRVSMVMITLEQRRQANAVCELGPAYAKRGWIRKKGD